MHADIFSTLLDAASIPVSKMNGKNPIRGMSLMPHALSSGEKSIPERTMIFELRGRIGLRRGDYKLYTNINSDRANWQEHVAELKDTDLSLFDLSQDLAEQNDLRTQLPEVYSSLKKELIHHFANINAEYPLVER
jgi:arylsulfatase A-like enzyme